jgi:hypothetical protein
MKVSPLAVLALALTSFSSQAMAWGADGHRTVAAIALKLLPPDKAQAAGADEVIRERDHRGVFSPWHFVDWPAARQRIPITFAALIASSTSCRSRSRRCGRRRIPRPRPSP